MCDERLASLERRAADAERRNDALHAELRHLLTRQQRQARWRRRERGITSGLAAGCVLTLTAWALQAQTPVKTLEERVKDLEGRVTGIGDAAGGTRFKAPFEVVDAAGTVILRAGTNDNGPFLQVGREAGGEVYLGVGKSGAGGLLVSDARGNIGLVLGQYRGGSMGVRVLGQDGATPQAELTLDAAGQGRLSVGDTASGSVELGVGKSGTGFVSVDRADGSIGALVGQYRQAPLSFSILSEQDQPLATMYGDTLGGSVRVMSPKGIPVGGLFSEEEGGGLVLTDPAGGSSVVDLGVRAGGGSVRVFSVGGSSTRAALEADTRTGGFTTFDDEGRPAAVLATMPGGSGRLQLRNGGETVVEGGTTTDGVGIVRAGPAAPRAVGALAIPHRIVGARK